MRRLPILIASVLGLAVVVECSPGAVAGENARAEAAKQAFGRLCASCHGTHGGGDGPAGAALPTKPRSFTDAKYMSSLTDDHLFKVIKEGGASVGKSPLMPPWGSQLKEQEIRDMVAYIRTLAQGGE